MNSSNIKHRSNLHSEQLEVLELLYRFRFGTNNLFAEYFNKSHRAFVHKRLNILLELGLIGKRFDSSYRIKGKPAAYYLLPAGVRALQASKPKKQASSINVKTIYKDKSVSENFIKRCQAIFAIYLKLKKNHKDNIKLFTKSDLTSYDYFLVPPPDLYIFLKDNKTSRRFFLELYEQTKPSFAINKRLKQLYDYFNKGIWQDMGVDFPEVLCVLDTKAQEKALIKQIHRATHKYSEDQIIQFYVTTIDRLINPDEEKTGIKTST